MILKKISLNHFQCLWIVHCVFEILSFIPHLGIKLYFNCIYTQNLIILKCNTYTIKFTLLMYTVFCLFVCFVFIIFSRLFSYHQHLHSENVHQSHKKTISISACSSLKPPPPLKPLIYISSHLWVCVVSYSWSWIQTEACNILFIFMSGFFSLVKYYICFSKIFR